jgi:hypothetical protein
VAVSSDGDSREGRRPLGLLELPRNPSAARAAPPVAGASPACRLAAAAPTASLCGYACVLAVQTEELHFLKYWNGFFKYYTTILATFTI